VPSLELDAVVIGGGVIGLAIARALAVSGRHVTLLEAEQQLGSHSSSRNSEVIHAGIYYATGSLKARMCVAGRDKLYEYCEREGVSHRRLGKIIVAVFITLFIGLSVTTGLGLMMVGSLNLLSIAFAVLFIGRDRS